MVTPSMTTPHETNRYESRRTPSLLLPEDPSQEELAQYWTLSARDQAEVLRCRGEAQRRRFAVQLCTLRAYGRFLPEAIAAPVAITNYLARQLDLPLVLFGEVPGRLATETEHLQRIRTYLGWQPFDDEARARLTHWLTQRATDDLLPSDLVTRAEDILRAWQIVLPAPLDPGRTRRLGDRARAGRGLHPHCHRPAARAAAGDGRPPPGPARGAPLDAVSAQGISPRGQLLP